MITGWMPSVPSRDLSGRSGQWIIVFEMGFGSVWRLALLAVAVLVAACGPTGPASPATSPASPTGEALADAAADKRFEEARENLIRELEDAGAAQTRVLEAMRRVPRHQFVREDYLDEAYANRPLPIGEGQTISQPYVVALMTEVLQLQEGDRVLEIGTGSGYQAAVLAEVGAEVYSIEIIPGLAQWAAENLSRTGYDEVTLLTADGYFGWEDRAPFDAIIVTAAPDHIPPPLLRQLETGGRMVIPVGPQGFYQTLWLIERGEDGLRSTNLGAVGFVPFTGPGVEGGGG